MRKSRSSKKALTAFLVAAAFAVSGPHVFPQVTDEVPREVTPTPPATVEKTPPVVETKPPVEEAKPPVVDGKPPVVEAEKEKEKPGEKKQVETPAPKEEEKAAEQRPAPKVEKKQKYFTLNFRDVEISEFLNVMGQLINKNIVVDEKVRGKITISSAKKIPVDQAYDIMKSILEVKGFAVVETENLIKVLPIQQVIKKNVEIISDGEKAISPDEDKTITYLLQIEFAEGNEIANVLRSLKSQFVDIVAYPPLNTLILSGTSSEISGLIKVARALDKKVEALAEEVAGRGNIHVIHLENSDAEQLAGVLARVPFSEQAKIETVPVTPQQPQTVPRSDRARRVMQAQPTAPPGRSATKLSIVANKETNSLIITATPEEFKEIYRIIKELDIVREQVLIEALIVEVSADNSWGFGIDWMLAGSSGQHMYGGSYLSSDVPNYTPPEGLEGKSLALPLATGLQIGYLSDAALLSFALLKANKTDRNFNLLSTPQVLTVDNQEAELNVGEEIAVPTNNRISDTGVQFYQFEYKSVGVKLKITPHITKQDRITLDLYQEVNSVLGETEFSPTGTVIPPKLGKRDIKTKVTVMDGKTIVVGGLIRNNKVDVETKVPILGDIPLLGWFFKKKSVSYSKTNLLVFITPYVVTKLDRIEALTEQKREEQTRMKTR